MKIKESIIKHKSFLIYCVFGAILTALETFLYWLLYTVIFKSQAGLYNTISTLLAWFITVCVAFFINKYIIYAERSWERKRVITEALSFFSGRVLSGAFNLGFMVLMVDILKLEPVIMKLIAALIVGIINYFVGKHIVFRKKN